MNDADSDFLQSSVKFVPLGIAAAVLGVTYRRVYDLVAENRLEVVSFYGARFVTVSSLLARRKHLLKLELKKSQPKKVRCKLVQTDSVS
jgi:hypothetical protein